LARTPPPPPPSKASPAQQCKPWILDKRHQRYIIWSAGKSTQTGLAILKLQLNIPKAKVLYSSATGASEPNNLAYMTRLGSCGFENMTALVKELHGYPPPPPLPSCPSLLPPFL